MEMRARLLPDFIGPRTTSSDTCDAVRAAGLTSSIVVTGGNAIGRRCQPWRPRSEPAVSARSRWRRGWQRRQDTRRAQTSPRAEGDVHAGAVRTEGLETWSCAPADGLAPRTG